MAESQAQSTMMEAPGPKYKFVEPEKLVKSPMDMAKWEKSETYYDLLGFINSICMCIQGRSLSYSCPISPTVQKLLDMLDKLEKLAIETPPVE
jgi:serine/threonine-protein phosphatase 2A activator